MSKTIVKVSTSLHGQAVDSYKAEVLNLDQFARFIHRDLNRGFAYRVTFGRREIAFCKPMPADYIAAQLAR